MAKKARKETSSEYDESSGSSGEAGGCEEVEKGKGGKGKSSKGKGKGKGKGKDKGKSKTGKSKKGKGKGKTEAGAGGAAGSVSSGKSKSKAKMRKKRKAVVATMLAENRALMDSILNLADLADDDLFLQERIRRAATLFQTFIDREGSRLSIEWLSQVKAMLAASQEVIQGSLAAYFFDMPAEQYHKAHYALDEILLRMAVTAFARADAALADDDDS
ncbi:uncharacterized protein AMSG_06811 [Thecamonas trahens ATCC 50062]|uniref:Uncharacterized protein n=1 Tax=Thecamonas trahens ATCC 50062 TaxID=461836 RepID=A0A0L0DG51_THETB|nr:hypothetical protein AMSG_06811 [Thecamonas trahens ATCC 50062]KNC50328.1 hypothetical protein AMSG_06811 [Thecamonas trahens ATCC 50062]|eukprot:XP_013756874.1 hypothetical protein AMSG_06811 [Thecamonas trahens ATCC 50062]